MQRLGYSDAVCDQSRNFLFFYLSSPYLLHYAFFLCYVATLSCRIYALSESSFYVFVTSFSSLILPYYGERSPGFRTFSWTYLGIICNNWHLDVLTGRYLTTLAVVGGSRIRRVILRIGQKFASVMTEREPWLAMTRQPPRSRLLLHQDRRRRDLFDYVYYIIKQMNDAANSKTQMAGGRSQNENNVQPGEKTGD